MQKLRQVLSISVISAVCLFNCYLDYLYEVFNDCDAVGCDDKYLLILVNTEYAVPTTPQKKNILEMAQNGELFNRRVKRETTKIHSLSDALVNAKFVVSLKDKTVWGNGLFVFYHVFAYLEDAKKRLKGTDYEKLFVSDVLLKKEAFEEDLAHYLGEKWLSLPKPLAVESYLEHLQFLEKDDPKLLMAYVYHLYLGLLHGGQVLAQKRRIFNDENSPTEKYHDKVTDFTGHDIGQLKRDFRRVLNEIAANMTEDEKQAFVEESNHVFILNNLIIDSVEGQSKVIRTFVFKIAVVLVLVTIAHVAVKSYM